MLARQGLASILISARGYKWDPVGMLRMCIDVAVSTLVHKSVPEAYTASGYRMFAELCMVPITGR